MHLNLENNKINDIIQNTLKNLSGVIDVNTVIGKPIKTDTGEIIIPVTKVTFGILSGGGEYGKMSIFKNNSQPPYSAGNGAIVSVKPCGFLIKGKNLEYKILSIAESSVEKFAEKAMDIISELEKNNEKN